MLTVSREWLIGPEGVFAELIKPKRATGVALLMLSKFGLIPLPRDCHMTYCAD